VAAVALGRTDHPRAIGILPVALDRQSPCP
jgi:hypothetical protein